MEDVDKVWNLWDAVRGMSRAASSKLLRLEKCGEAVCLTAPHDEQQDKDDRTVDEPLELGPSAFPEWNLS